MLAHIVLHDTKNEHDPTIVGVCHRPMVNAGQPFHAGYILLDRKTLADLGYTIENTGQPTWLRSLVFDIFHTEMPKDSDFALHRDYTFLFGEHSRTMYNDTHLIVENIVLSPAAEAPPPTADPLTTEQKLLAFMRDRSASTGPNGCTECEDTGCVPDSPLCLAMAITGKLTDLGL